MNGLISCIIRVRSVVWELNGIYLEFDGLIGCLIGCYMVVIQGEINFLKIIGFIMGVELL